MITIDGAEGEGGGQVLRTALALALVTGRPFRIDGIRAGRSPSGLMRQHVTAVEAACAVGAGDCEGLAVGASSLCFRPGRVAPGSYRFAVGTAGSTGLVLQTVLPALMLAQAPSRLVLEGGTHNPGAPTFDFIDRTFLPVVAGMGPRITARLERPGFFPAGGGRIAVAVEPVPVLARLDLTERGALRGTALRALIAALPDDIATRELQAAGAVLGWPDGSRRLVRLPDRVGPGNVLIVEAAFDAVTEICTGFGRLGVSAERVAGNAAKRMAGYLASAAAAGPYLADQLLLPMALAGGGRFTTVTPSSHTRTAAAVIARFLDVGIRFRELPDGRHLVSVG